MSQLYARSRHPCAAVLSCSQYEVKRYQFSSGKMNLCSSMIRNNRCSAHASALFWFGNAANTPPLAFSQSQSTQLWHLLKSVSNLVLSAPSPSQSSAQVLLHALRKTCELVAVCPSIRQHKTSLRHLKMPTGFAITLKMSLFAVVCGLLNAIDNGYRLRWSAMQQPGRF